MSLKEIRLRGLNSLKGKFGVMILITIICELLLAALSSSVVLAIIFSGPLMLGLYTSYLKCYRNQDIEVEDLFSGLDHLKNSIILYILQTIYIFLWTLLLIVPGIIKAISYSMSFFIMSDEPDITASEALKKSEEMMEGNKMRYFLLSLSFIGWILLSVLTLGILLIWLVPYMYATQTAFYEEIKSKTHSSEDNKEVDAEYTINHEDFEY